MGCFSFRCKQCGEPINSNSFSGQHCTLYLLEDGKIIERMTGQYDSYGRVFDTKGESVEWKSYPWSGTYVDGKRLNTPSVCDLMFNDDKSNGIAAFHTDCGSNEALPTTRSEDDPEQGWGSYPDPILTYHQHAIYNRSK